MRWAREDLEEDLLDVKLAVIEVNSFELPTVIQDVKAALSRVYQILNEMDEEDFDIEDDS